MFKISEKRKKHLLDMLILFAVAWIPLMITSIYIFVTGSPIEYYNMDLSFITQIYNELLAIGVLLYILHKQKRKITEIGFSFKLKDILHSILIIISVYIIYFFIGIIVNLVFGYVDTTPNNIEFLKNKLSIWYVIFILINPWFEELIIRGYIITEVKKLTKNIYLAVFVSVFMQSIVHLYQGFLPVIYLTAMFLIFSIYFIKTKRIVPVILAHLFFDVLAMLTYAV